MEQFLAPIRKCRRIPRETCVNTLRLAFIFLGLLLLSRPALAQKPIHVDVNLVNVAFTARDSNGALVANLTKDQVELYEDAVPQKIEFFTRSTDLPLTLALIMDVSGSQEHFEKKHRKDLQIFLQEVLGPRDRVFMVCFGNHLRLVSDYTNSPEELLNNFQEFDKGKKHFPELGPKEDRDLGTAFYDSIFYSVSEKLSEGNGRKAILMFSDGEDNSSSHNMMQAIEAAQAQNVIIYSIRYTATKHGELNAWIAQERPALTAARQTVWNSAVKELGKPAQALEQINLPLPVPEGRSRRD